MEIRAGKILGCSALEAEHSREGSFHSSSGVPWIDFGDSKIIQNEVDTTIFSHFSRWMEYVRLIFVFYFLIFWTLLPHAFLIVWKKIQDFWSIAEKRFWNNYDLVSSNESSYLIPHSISHISLIFNIKNRISIINKIYSNHIKRIRVHFRNANCNRRIIQFSSKNLFELLKKSSFWITVVGKNYRWTIMDTI